MPLEIFACTYLHAHHRPHPPAGLLFVAGFLEVKAQGVPEGINLWRIPKPVAARAPAAAVGGGGAV